MTTNQKIKLRMYLGVRNFVSQNETTANSIPKFAQTYANLLMSIDEIQLIGEMQGVNKTGLALDKNRLKMNLINMAVKYSNKIVILAKQTNNDTLLKEVKFSESDLLRLSEVTLKERAKIIYDKAEANLSNLAEQGLTAETQKKFLETISAFNKALETPRTGIAEKSKATQKLLVLFDKADSEIEIMDLAAGSAKDEYPDFFNGYKTSRKLIDANSGTLALKAAARDLVNGEPVSGAIFIFKNEALKGAGMGELIKKTTKKGNFHIKSMETGNYKVVISKKGYKNQEAAINVTEGERSDLTVELEKA